MPGPVLVILIVAGVVVVSLGVLKLVLVVWGRIAQRVERAAAARLAERHVPQDMLLHETMANFFGEESRGPAQMRGNGGLVLTRDALVFHMLVPDRTIAIPLEDIREVSLVRSHLGKRVGRDLVHVRYATPGGTDAIAWFVRDTGPWVRELLARSPGARAGGTAPH